MCLGEGEKKRKKKGKERRERRRNEEHLHQKIKSQQTLLQLGGNTIVADWSSPPFAFFFFKILETGLPEFLDFRRFWRVCLVSFLKVAGKFSIEEKMALIYLEFWKFGNYGDSFENFTIYVYFIRYLFILFLIFFSELSVLYFIRYIYFSKLSRFTENFVYFTEINPNFSIIVCFFDIDW